MRTTVTLDPDTEEMLRNAVAQRHVSFEEVLNDAIRKGLAPPVKTRKTAGVEVPTFRSAYCDGVDRGRLQQVADNMESDVFSETVREPGGKE